MRKLATIVAADVAGFSNLIGADEEGTIDALRALRRELIEPSLQRHSGRIVNRAGDGIIMEFASALDGVRCAISIQKGMAERNAGAAPGKRIEFRIGMHLSDVVVEEDGDLMGEGVNIAARLESIASPGDIFLSEEIWRHAGDKLDVKFIDLGAHQLKHISRPIKVYAILLSEQSRPETFAGLRARYPVLPDKPSIAVLPFLNLTGDPGKDYFSDAITEDVITALARWHWFFVISRNSSFAYKGKGLDNRQIARELGVRYILEGSVQQSAGRVRITGQLIDTGLDAHIWADAFDRELTDLFALQDEISERVVSAIEPAMRHSEGIRIVKKNKISMSAFDCFQHGMWHFNKMSKEDNASAIALFRKSIVLDPEMSHGHTGLARALYNNALQQWTDNPALDFAESARIARQAIALDPRDAYGHFALSGALLYLAQHDEALAEARKAVALNPNFAFGHFRLGQVLTYLGRSVEAVAPIERSIRLSPHDPQLGAMRAQLALTHYHIENYEISAEQAQEAVRLQYIPALGVLAPSLARLGKADEALRTLAAYAPHLEKQMQTQTLSLPPYAHARDRLHLLEGLRLAGLPNSIISAVH